MFVIIGIWLLFVQGVYSFCEHPRCGYTCRTKNVGDEEEIDRCLELCRIPCEVSNDTSSTDNSVDNNSVEKAVVKYFSTPSRWIPTVIGSIIAVGVVCAVVYYFRKSWKKRDRFPKYGFSRLRGRNRDPATDTDMTELSDVGR